MEDLQYILKVYENWTTLVTNSTGKRRVSIYKGSFYIDNCEVEYCYHIILENYGMTPEFVRDIYSMTFAMAKFIANDFLYNEYWGTRSKYE